MIRRLLGLLAATFLLASPAVAQQTNPSGGGGGGCPTATPCTVEQTIAPASTSVNALIVNMPASSTANGLDIKLNGTSKFQVTNGGTLTQRGGTQQFGNYDINYGQYFGWSDGSTNRAKIFQTGGSGCSGGLTIYDNGNTGSVPSVQIGTSKTIDGPLVQGSCAAGSPATRGYTGDIANGTNITGGKVQLLGGSSTGTGGGGAATLATSPKGSTGATVNAQRDVVIADTNAHVSYGGTIPTVGGSCGTSPTIRAGSTDTAGAITTGSGSPTSCTITFNLAYTAKPFCVVQAETPANLTSAVASTTLITITTVAPSAVFTYACPGA